MSSIFFYFFLGSWKLDFPLLLVFIAPLCGFRALAPMIIKDLSSLWVLFRGVSHVLTSLSFCIFIITDVLKFVKCFFKFFGRLKFRFFARGLQPCIPLCFVRFSRLYVLVFLTYFVGLAPRFFLVVDFFDFPYLV